ncbi:MAG: hypothetical protein ACK4UN_19935, partial [Limisphaerales bacterium]
TDYNSLRFNNQAGGRFVKAAGLGNAVVVDTAFLNRGEIRVESGGLQFHSLLLEDGNRLTGNGGDLATYNGRIEFRGQTIIDQGQLLLVDGTFHGEPNSSITTTNGGLVQWHGSTLSGNVELSQGSAMHVLGNSLRTFAGGALFRNRGNILWFDNGGFYNFAYFPAEQATFDNYGTLLILGNGRFDYSYHPSLFRNREGASVIKWGGTNVTDFNWSFDNAGELVTTNGIVSLNTGGSSTGLFQADNQSTIRFNGGVHTLNNGSRFAGAGKLLLESGTLRRAGMISSDVSKPATLEITAGSFDGTGALTGPMTVNWANGTISGVLDVGANVTVNALTVSAKSLYAAAFNNSGTFNWYSGAIYSYAYNLSERSVFNNLSGGVFNIAGDGNIFDVAYSSSSFTNHAGGVIRKSAGWGTSVLDDFEFSNAGEVRVDTGTLRSQANLVIEPGAAFTGAEGTFTFSGNTLAKTPLLSSINLTLDSGTLTGATNVD